MGHRYVVPTTKRFSAGASTGVERVYVYISLYASELNQGLESGYEGPKYRWVDRPTEVGFGGLEWVTGDRVRIYV